MQNVGKEEAGQSDSCVKRTDRCEMQTKAIMWKL